MDDMRVRIRRHLDGVIDGVALHQFELGSVYDVDESLGGYLVTTGAAVQVFSPKLPRTMDEDGGFPSSMLTGGVTVVFDAGSSGAVRH